MRSTYLDIVLISVIYELSFGRPTKSVTLNGEIALILHYFTAFVYDVVVKQMLGLPRCQNLLWIVYDHINTICAII